MNWYTDLTQDTISASNKILLLHTPPYTGGQDDKAWHFQNSVIIDWYKL